MDFLQKLDFLMEKYDLNKLTLSQNSGIPYSTIVGWYKKGYEGLKLTTLRKLSDYFNTVLDYWVTDDVIDPNYWKANGFIVNGDEMEKVQKYRLLDPLGKEAVDSVLEVEYRRYEENQPPLPASVQAQLVPDLAAEIAELKRQNQEMAAEIAALKEEDAKMEAAAELSAWPSVSAGSRSPADRAKK